MCAVVENRLSSRNVCPLCNKVGNLDTFLPVLGTVLMAPFFLFLFFSSHVGALTYLVDFRFVAAVCVLWQEWDLTSTGRIGGAAAADE